MEFFQQGMVRFSADQMIEHIHRGGEKRFDTGLSSVVGNTLGQVAFSNPRIANQDDIHFLPKKLQGKQI